MKKIFKENYTWIILFLCLISLIVLITFALIKENLILDEKGYYIVSKYLIKDNITPIAKIITFLASTYFFIGLSILLLILVKNKKTGLSIIVNLGLSALTNFIVKNIVQRPRPIDHRLISETGFSLPSGHSMVSMAFYGYLIYLTYKYIKNKKIKISLTIFLSLLIFLVGLSRIYLGVHYTTDVLAGYLLGISYLIIYINVINNVLKNK